MIVQKEGESRQLYLVRVAIEYIEQHDEYFIDFDEVTCDGGCLAEDLRIEFNIEE